MIHRFKMSFFVVLEVYHGRTLYYTEFSYSHDECDINLIFPAEAQFHM